MRSYDRIVIHERCKHTAEEFRLYSYKIDKNNGDMLPVVVDANNHVVDAIRYALNKVICNRGDVKTYSWKPDDW